LLKQRHNKKLCFRIMVCPCLDCLEQFLNLITRGFIENYTCWNKHGEEGLNEGEVGCLNEGEA
jgi:hypothetical protein